MLETGTFFRTVSTYGRCIIEEEGELSAGEARRRMVAFHRRSRICRQQIAAIQSGLACCAGHMGHHAEAAVASERALRIEPGNAEFTNDLGWSLLQAGRLAEAETMLQRAVELDSSNEIARNNLKLCRDRLAK